MWSPAKPDELESFRLRRNTEIPHSSFLIELLSLISYLLTPICVRSRRGIYIPAEMWYPVPNGIDRAGTARPA